jgi:hypothetical protein
MHVKLGTNLLVETIGGGTSHSGEQTASGEEGFLAQR